MEFQCNGYCPIQTLKGCCKNCNESYACFKSDTNKQFWTDENGFWDGGCSLSREAMPKECREYDCRNYDWVVTKRWIDDRWQDVDLKEIPLGCRVMGTIDMRKKNGDCS